MGFNKLLGQSKAVEMLQAALNTERIAHAYLFHGPGGVGKNKAAVLFAQALNCEKIKGDIPCGSCSSCGKISSGNHPDIRKIAPEGASIKIAQIRNLQEKAYYKCYEGRFKVIMIDDADLFTIEAANCLLKILEEPPEQTVFILMAEDTGKLPVTILSRCQVVPFGLLDESVIRDVLAGQGEDIVIVSGLTGGSVGKTLEIREKFNPQQLFVDIDRLLEDLRCGSYREVFAWAEFLEKDKELLDIVLEIMSVYYRDRIVSQSTGEKSLLLNSLKLKEYSLTECYAALFQLNKVFEYLKSNANTRLVLEVFLINLSNIEQRKKEKGGNPQW